MAPVLARPAEGAPAAAVTARERASLLHVQCQALHYFLENQTTCGLMLDRQSNHGPRRVHGLCSTAASGMGFVALALAAVPPYRLLTPSAAIARLRAGLEGALRRLPHDHGVVPHFVESAGGAVYGSDVCSTVETAWLVAGALWAADFLADPGLQLLAHQLYERVDWRYWTAPAAGGPGLLRHGKGADGRFLPWSWDRLNGETIFMYVLAAGADGERAVAPSTWRALCTFHGSVGGQHFNNADLGLFVFQYGLDLLDLESWRPPCGTDLWAEAGLAARANEQVCRETADTFHTYRRFWGLSAGDGPGDSPADDTYRAYAPSGPVDGTAHLTATVASVAHRPEAVLRNLAAAEHDPDLRARGRYGFSAVNLDRGWVGRDMVGIDAGAAILALDNYLHAGRVRAVFHRLPCVARALDRLGFRSRLTTGRATEALAGSARTS